jgi:hypothetical protein
MTTNKKPRILVFARQPGSASAFAPLCRKLVNLYDFEVLLLPLTYATAPEFKNRYLASSTSEVTEKLSHDIDLFITGTSLEATADSALWQFAKSINIPIIAYVDHSYNITSRFSTDKSQWPDYIAVLDDEMKREVQKIGFSSSSISITGNPQLEALCERAVELRPTTRLQQPLAVFVCEPVVNSGQFRAMYGYTDLESLELATQILARESALTSIRWKLNVKLHPRDTEHRVRPTVLRLTSHHPEIDIAVTELSKEQVFSNARVVFGMSSTLLNECATLRIPTISCRPNSTLLQSLPTSNTSILIVNEARQYNVLEKAAELATHSKSPTIDSCRRFHDLIRKALLTRERN